MEDKLSEQTRYLETLSQKYDSLKEKMGNYDVLEEKVYLLERERKESRDMKQHLEEKIERLHAEKEEWTQMNENNTLVNTNLENEISKLREDRDKFENQYVNLRSEKESLVEELTKRLGVLDEQKKALALEKNELETKLKTFENENKDLKLKLDSTAQGLKGLKEAAKQNAKEKDVDEMERELAFIKKQKDEAEKTCEDLASKLSKAYAELEQAKSLLNNDGVPGGCFVFIVYSIQILLTASHIAYRIGEENFLIYQDNLLINSFRLKAWVVDFGVTFGLWALAIDHLFVFQSPSGRRLKQIWQNSILNSKVDERQPEFLLNN